MPLKPAKAFFLYPFPLANSVDKQPVLAARSRPLYSAPGLRRELMRQRGYFAYATNHYQRISKRKGIERMYDFVIIGGGSSACRPPCN